MCVRYVLCRIVVRVCLFCFLHVATSIVDRLACYNHMYAFVLQGFWTIRFTVRPINSRIYSAQQFGCSYGATDMGATAVLPKIRRG
jgi:hypothetical protein